MMRAPGLTALLILLAASAAAQQPHRSGYTLEAAAGYAFHRIATSDSAVHKSTGTSEYLRLTRVLGSRVSAGLEFKAYQGSSDSVSTHVNGLEAIALFYPGRMPLYLQMGVGLANGRVLVLDSLNRTFEGRGTGVGLSFGTGYELPMGPRWAISANASVHFAALGDIGLANGQVAEEVIATTYQLGLGITFR
jgi:hypothetical protein